MCTRIFNLYSIVSNRPATYPSFSSSYLGSGLVEKLGLDKDGENILRPLVNEGLVQCTISSALTSSESWSISIVLYKSGQSLDKSEV